MTEIDLLALALRKIKHIKKKEFNFNIDENR